MTSAFVKIAFIGLGQMGLPMAKHLVAAGFPVTGFDLSSQALEQLHLAGGKTETNITHALAGADCVITMLPSGKIVQDVLLGGEAALNEATNTALVIDMSSSAPSDTRVLHKLLPHNQRLVDAPVSGGVKRAVDGSLAIMVGGEDSDIDEAEPLLEKLSAKIFRCGPVGAGHAMKAINNYVSGTSVIAAIEAVQLGKAFGLNPENMIDVLNASSGKNNATEVKMKQFVLSGTFGSGFGLGLMAKDIRIAAELSKSLGLEQHQLQEVADTWDAAAEAIGGTADHTKIAEYLGKSK
jgi:3-hydroxyisobutyrate dehydrogenase